MEIAKKRYLFLRCLFLNQIAWTHCNIDYSLLGSFLEAYIHMLLMLCFLSSAFYNICYVFEGDFGSIICHGTAGKLLGVEKVRASAFV